ncbi:2-dehydro-3-deoxy-6-phosphogalactonate aldolase [Shewanella acanthi]|uniref:2-dehydro-3-deoxy-6-phosphogalactonate aldolase n=1 Tax=Shewanella acanthi TaxID=2864212 RepID=UPI001C65D62E|nr:2-dehydro-3-deoxy-6-phosphogalactonate aldolase [Shewanella acanthi]QYJ78337.1 2-dehydro-3-deoxy-6-phosphogalactonate aldolase [Shewanella acanthi]
MNPVFEKYNSLPLIGILRGVRPEEVVEVVNVLYESGFKMVEVPLNSPEPYKSIELLTKHFSDRMLIGAGTVLSVEQVHRVAQAGGKLIVSPNIDAEVIIESKKLHLVSVPGVATPSEALQAYKAGADAIKAFPCDSITSKGIKSWRSVLPKDLPIYAVGGIELANMEEYWNSGCDGFGLGSSLYKPGVAIEDLHRIATSFVQCCSILTKS